MPREPKLTTDREVGDRLLAAYLSTESQSNVAIVNKNGVIIETNDSWMEFGRQRDADLRSIGPGASYFQVCRNSSDNCADAAIALEGIISVLNGVQPCFMHAYACHSSTERAWFVMRVHPLQHARGAALIAHQKLTGNVETGLRYSEILDYVRAIVWTADPATLRTTYASVQTTSLLGYEPEVFIQDPAFWSTHIHPEDRDRVIAFTSSEIAAKRNHTLEYRLIAADGRVVWLRNIVNVVVDGENVRELVGIAVDITELKEVERALRESEQRFRATFEQAAVGIAHLALDGRFLRVNRRYSEIVGYPNEELLKLNVQDITHAEDLAPVVSQLPRVLNGETITYSREKRYIRKDQSVVWANVTGSLISDNGHPLYYMSVVEDITKRKEAEQALRDLSARLIDTQELERRRIAKELHEGLAQSLTAVALGLSQLEKISSLNISPNISGLQEQIQSVLSQITNLSYQLHPSALALVGLEMAIRQLCQEVSQTLRIRINFSATNVRRDLPEEVKLCLYRITQEALRNVAKHSEAHCASVVITQRDNDLELVIKDDGVGFSAGSAHPGLGLPSMQERLRNLKGSLVVDSQPGSGTKIHIRIPLASPQAAQ